MDDNLVTNESFFFYNPTRYDFIDYYGALYPREDNDLHMAFISCGILFDYETGEEITLLRYDENGCVISPIYTNKIYLTDYKLVQIDKKLIKKANIDRANEIIDNYILNKDLESQGKIVKFKGKRLY